MNPDDFLKLAAAGLTTDQIALVMEMMARDAKAYADAEEARKEKGRQRVAKWRLEHNRNVTETAPKVSVRLARAVDSRTSNSEIEPQVKNNGRSDLEGFKAELSPDLDADHLEALLKHRRLKKSQITAHAARLFRRDATACGLSLAEAVDTCISRNWITVKAEWLTERRQQGPPTRAPTAQELLKARRQEIKDDERPPDRPMLVASR